MKKPILLTLMVLAFFTIAFGNPQKAVQSEKGEIVNRWTKEKANEWYNWQPWLRGCNFIPGTAINQLEMWQAESFDPQTISRELKWAKDIGMNCMRVYLHHVAWEIDKEGLKKRMKEYL